MWPETREKRDVQDRQDNKKDVRRNNPGSLGVGLCRFSRGIDPYLRT